MIVSVCEREREKEKDEQASSEEFTMIICEDGEMRKKREEEVKRKRQVGMIAVPQTVQTEKRVLRCDEFGRLHVRVTMHVCKGSMQKVSGSSNHFNSFTQHHSEKGGEKRLGAYDAPRRRVANM